MPASPRTDPAPSARLPTIVFDVAETLLDLDGLAPVFTRIFGEAGMVRRWFDQVVLYSEALTLAGDYAPAGTVGVAVLEMLARIAGKTVDPAALEQFKRLNAALPTYPDVAPALAALGRAGLRLVALSNTPCATLDTQLAAAGLRLFFDAVHSIDDRVRRFKPALESYAALGEAPGLGSAGFWLVSCHAFDTLGAAAAGWRTALVLRPGNAPIALGQPPDIVGDTLHAVAARIIAETGAGPGGDHDGG